MKSNLFLFLLSTITCLDTFKLNSNPPERIVGGYEVQPKFKYPWMVSLAYEDFHFCGGTLYNYNTIISAAHCIYGEPKAWSARLHRHNLKILPIIEDGKVFNVTQLIQHPKYVREGNQAYDVAIYKINNLDKTINNFSHQLILNNNSNELNKDGQLLKIIGWGLTTMNGQQSDVLREVKLPIFNFKKCDEIYKGVDPSQFCAGFPEGGKDSCQTDSGGPIFIEKGAYHVLMGVVSWGEGCALKDKPGVYTRVDKVLDFIKENAA